MTTPVSAAAGTAAPADAALARATPEMREMLRAQEVA